MFDMKFTFLGTGPTEYVKGKGKNRRLNSSAFIQTQHANILIDVTPQFDIQSKKIDRIDVILLTHGHKDAVNGWYKLREWLKKKNNPRVTVLCEKETRDRILDDFKDVSFVDFKFFKPGTTIKIGNLRITPFRVIHFEPFETDGKRFPTVGFRINNLVYAEDMESIPPESEKYFENADVIIVDGAMWFGHQIRGHMNTEQALEIAKKFNPRYLLITQAGRTYPPYEKAQKIIEEKAREMNIKSKVKLTYDGMTINFKRKLEVLQKDEGETREEASERFWKNNWYKVYPKSGKGKFVYHHHWRGLTEEEKDWDEAKLLETERSVHGDLRFQFEPDSLFGFTVFLGPTKEVRKGRDVYTLKEPDKLQGTWKQLQPKEWLTFEGVTKPGQVGATSKKYAKFFIEDSGTYEIGVWREHFIELFLHGKKLKGRFTIVYAPVGEGGRKWLIGRPEDQTPYAKSHKKEEVIKELKEKGQKYLIWAAPGIKPVLYDVEKVKLESLSESLRFTLSLHQLGLTKHFDLHLEKDGYCESWAFMPMKVGEKNVLKIGSRLKRKAKEPLEVLDFEGTIPKGKPGASRNYCGIVKILEKGKYTPIKEERGFFEYLFRGKKLNGRFVIKQIEDKNLVQKSKYRYVFLKSESSELDELLTQLELLLRANPRTEENIYSDIQITAELESEKLVPLIIRGIALKEGTWNGLFYPREEIRKAASNLAGKPLMIDHGKSVRDIVGRVKNTSWNPALNALEFEAEIIDENIAKKVLEGLITGVSVGVIVDRIKEGSNLVARNYEFKELSLVLVPACTDCKILDVQPPTNHS